MSRFPFDAPVTVHPFTARRDGDEAVVGDARHQTFLAIPVDALDLLEWLAEGVTLGEAVRRYEERHGDTPEVEPFLDTLAGEGFVAPAGGAPAPPQPPSPPPPGRVWNLDRLSPATARRLLGVPVLAGCGALVVVAVVLAAGEPTVLPGPSSLAFETNFSAYLWTVMAIAAVGLFGHELAHVVGARAAGVQARIRVGNQMYAIVVQTEMSGIWLVPRRQRYLALLAGMIVDLTGAAVLVILLWLDRVGLVGYPEPVRIVLSAVLFTHFIRLLWQTFVFLRTDLYYVAVTALGTRSLMADTDAYLRNVVRRVLRRRLVDTSGVGPREMRAVRLFSVVWLAGRILALVVLVTATVPLLVYYAGRVLSLVRGEPVTGTFTWVDVLSIAAFVFVVEGGGVVMWVRSLLRARRARRQAPDRVLVE